MRVLLYLLLAFGLCGPAFTGEPVRYVLNPSGSRLSFTGTQAGAPFEGSFGSFSTKLLFSPDSPQSSTLEVDIDLSSESSADHDRDETIKGRDLFDIAKYPSAHYAALSMIKTNTGYTAQGSLTLHGVTKVVPIVFTLETANREAVLRGSATLKRLDFNVGQGDWKNTEWAGNEVTVRFSLSLVPA